MAHEEYGKRASVILRETFKKKDMEKNRGMGCLGKLLSRGKREFGWVSFVRKTSAKKKMVGDEEGVPVVGERKAEESLTG